ncbi:MAG: PEP-CTERM sorting domain-containing protein [Scytonema sp. RU_4_4]|nr:PEP-CTERM sorting domain-containing protein [Scytonema sp. RU_4_4]
MNIHKKLAVTISSVVCVLTTMKAAPVLAATFNFSYFGTSILDSTNTVTASGVLTTDPYDPVTDSYQITGITGTRNGVAIDSLLSENSFLDNNNLLFDSSPQLDEFGFAYTVEGQSYNVFNTYQYLELGYIGTYDTGASSTPVNSAYPLSSFSLTLVTPVTPIPEPSSILGILGISVLAGGTLLKRSYRSVYATKSKITKFNN